MELMIPQAQIIQMKKKKKKKKKKKLHQKKKMIQKIYIVFV